MSAGGDGGEVRTGAGGQGCADRGPDGHHSEAKGRFEYAHAGAGGVVSGPGECMLLCMTLVRGILECSHWLGLWCSLT